MTEHAFLAAWGRGLTMLDRAERALAGGLVLAIAGVIVASVLFR